MHRFILPLLAIVLAAPALATPPDAEAEARALATRWVAAWNAYDADGLLASMADGAILAWPDGSTETITDREVSLEEGRQFFAYAASQGLHLDMEIESVYVHEATAVVFLRGAMTGDTMDDVPTHIALTLVRRGDTWKVAAEHAMAIQQQG